MSTPHRPGMTDAEWERRIAPQERARVQALRRLTDREDAGGLVVIWYRTAGGVAPSRWQIQPGVADDLPSLLSILAAEIGWPGAPAPPDPAGYAPDHALAVWARVWQVRDAAELRVFLRWDAEGAFHGEAVLAPLAGEATPLLSGAALRALLAKVAVNPRASESPHGLLLAGNRAMEAGDYAAARACYARAVADLPRHPEAHRNLALALARLGEWQPAAAVMRQAWALAPADPVIEQEYLALETDAGIQAARQGDQTAAAAHFLRILEHWPEEPTALVNLGNIRLREGRRQEARAIFQRFLRLHPEHAAASEVRLALAAMGEPEQAGS